MNGPHSGYASYYKHQIGGSGGIDVYSGALGQRGHGIGGILGGMLRGITPMFKTLGSSVGKSLLNVGMGTLDDVLRTARWTVFKEKKHCGWKRFAQKRRSRVA